jgi:hypothetical protein
MEDAGAKKLHESNQTPCLFMAPAENILGKFPLTPCFLDGNITPTIPHTYTKNRNSCFPTGCADTAAEEGRFGRMRLRHGCGSLGVASLVWVAWQ